MAHGVGASNNEQSGSIGIGLLLLSISLQAIPEPEDASISDAKRDGLVSKNKFKNILPCKGGL